MSEPVAGKKTTPISPVAETLVPPTQAPASTGPLGPLVVPGEPQRIGRYEIRRQLGKGGMGVVYLAFDTQMHREVALKVPSFRADEDPSVIERFYREARTAGRLQHPNICPVHDVDQVEGIHYLSMACIEGETLAKKVGEYAGRPPQAAAALIRKVALALEEAHRQGIIHRDLKPQNIMIDRRGEPIVMDFGLAREIRSATSELSHPGMVMGTPMYMPPEQARGDVTAMGPGCDIYSLGVVLYQLLIGRVPFEGTTLEVIARHLRDEPPAPHTVRPDLDPRIEAICLKAMAKEPSQRFLCMSDFASALEAFIQGETTAPAAVMSEDDPLSRSVADVLHPLRTWGWRGGVERIKAGQDSDAASDPRRALLIRWLSGEASVDVEAREAFREVRQFPALVGWALLGRAYLLNRSHSFTQSEPLLRAAEKEGDPRDNILQASIAHQRGFLLDHLGRLSEALNHLHAALDLCGRHHALTGWVLDTLGMVYAARNSFHTARDLLRQALASVERFGDLKGQARIRGHLGLIHLHWLDLNAAEEHFQQSLLCSQKINDGFGQGAMYNFLGQVALYRGKKEAQTGRKAVAKRHWADATDLLQASIKVHHGRQSIEYEGYSYKDLARVALAQGNLDLAEQHVRKAEELFRVHSFEEGMAHVQRVWGTLHRLRGNFTEASRALQSALTHFDRTANTAEGALVQLEIARNLADSGEIRQLTSRAYLEALRRAEASRRDEMVAYIEDELKGVDEEAHWHHVFHRSRGRGATTRTASLDDGESEVASVLFLNLVGFVQFCQGLDSSDVMRTLNQMMGDLAEVLERQQGFVTVHLGGGFMAMFRGQGHAERAVQSALDMLTVVRALNRPRAVLGLRQLPVRVGIASGSLFLGNIGTYHKMDFTAVGMPANLAARLVRQAESNGLCISEETFELVGERFAFVPGNPRKLDLPGIGLREVWDVIGRKEDRQTERG